MKTESKPAIRPIIGKGLQLNLEVYHKLKAFQAGGEFWEHQSQMIIREHIGDFLPIMSVDERGEDVLCQMFVNGTEVSSQSKVAKGVPSKERFRLEAAIKALKQKAESPHIDSTTNKIIQEFKLPDPLKDPELYRTYGSRWNPKLMVIWGCEKEFGTSVIPEEAPRRVARESVGAGAFRRLPWIALILLLLLGGIWALNEYDLIKKPGDEVVENVTPGKDVKGNPVRDENGKPFPERKDGFPIAVGADGKPITDPNGTPLPADPEGNPIAVNPDNVVVRDADDKTLPARVDKFPVATDEEGNPVTGPDGKLLPADKNGALAVNAEDEVVMGPDDKLIPGRADNLPVATGPEGDPIYDLDGNPLPADPQGNPLAVDKDDKVVTGEDGNPLPARGDHRPIAKDENGKPITGAGNEPLPAERPSDPPTKVIVIDGPQKQSEIPESGKITPSAPRPASTDEAKLATLTRPAVVTIAVGNAEGDYKGQGSGFLITSDGLVVTNHHVIADGSQFVALLADGSPLSVVKVLASDAPRDLALLRIETEGRTLPYLALAPEDYLLEVGNKIAVMGSPHGLEGTFTTGIVSAKRKDKDVDVIQITAPVSPGSSGSPVVDTEATVVGIVTGGIVEDMAQALNFAVSVSELHELLKTGGEEAKKSITQSPEPGAINRQSRDKIDDSLGIGKRPEGGDKEVKWEKDPVYQAGDIMPQPDDSGRGAEDPPNSSVPQIAIKELSREQVENGGIKIVLAAKLKHAKDGLVDAQDLEATLGGNKLEVKGSHITLVAQEGSHTLLIKAKDPKTGNPCQLVAEIDVTVKADVNIKVKED